MPASPTRRPATARRKLLATYRVEQVGVERLASSGSHVAIAVIAAGFENAGGGEGGMSSAFLQEPVRKVGGALYGR